MSSKARESDKAKKVKLVRDSFCMPKDEYAAIDALKTRALGLSLAVKKSELLRAGLMALGSMSDTALKQVLASVPTLKTGRPPVEAAPTEQTPVPPAKAAPKAARKTPTKAQAPSAPADAPGTAAALTKAPAKRARKPRTAVATSTPAAV